LDTSAHLGRLDRVLRRVATDLEANGVRWALVGGLAVSARSEPRFTRDIDLALAVGNDADSELLLSRLFQLGYRLEALLEQTSVNRLATARLSPPEESRPGVIVDLLVASSGIEPEVVAAADPLEVFPGFPVPVARTGHLIALKVLSQGPQRPQDLADLGALLAAAPPEDLELARSALAEITGRGFHRGKNLAGEFQNLLSLRSP
jgi:Nucleotidyl transferase AbiEii toxin, Type IV TA system